MREKGEVFTAKLQNLLDRLEIRFLVLFSLFLQIFLIATGNRRKYRKNKLISSFLWFFYLSADYIATTALGVLSRAKDGGSKSSSDEIYAIRAFWAPFLLLHLGGPDTITAYALADNELWSRHLLGLVGQVGVAAYVLLKSWTGAHVNYLWMVIFFAGFIKYGERSWVLYSASKDRFREAIVTDPDPGPNYPKFTDELVIKEFEGYDVTLTKPFDTVQSVATEDPMENFAYAGEGIDQHAAVLQEAFSLFGTFKKLFTDLILSFQDKEKSLSIFMDVDMNWEKAFKIVEVELGLVYDLFYTKALAIYTRFGLLYRGLSCTFIVAALVGFVFIDKNFYPETEVIITYILLVGAFFLEIYAILILVSSDRVMIWFTGDWTTMPALKKFNDFMSLLICRFVSGLRMLHIVPSRKRWSNAMGQYNVFNCCIRGKRKCKRVRQYLEYLFGKTASVPNGLKALIFRELKRRIHIDEEKLGTYSGDRISYNKLMSHYDKDYENYEVSFDQSLLLWHMATDLCYYTEVQNGYEPDEGWLSKVSVKDTLSGTDVKVKREICKILSNYMMHLLIMSPFMLPSGIGLIRFQDTCAEATDFFNKKRLDKKEACEKLRRVDTRLAPSRVKGDRSKSLLFDACRLARALGWPEVENNKWDVILQAWLDILTYAAAQCSWSNHAEKLSEGGELLTHVWLLMAHFGMTDQFQIAQGYVRAKLQLA